MLTMTNVLDKMIQVTLQKNAGYLTLVPIFDNRPKSEFK